MGIITISHIHGSFADSRVRVLSHPSHASSRAVGSDAFHDDSVVRISWIKASGPEFVRRSKEMAERNVNASHRLGPIYVTLAGDRAIAQLVVIIDIPFKLEGIEVMLSNQRSSLRHAR